MELFKRGPGVAFRALVLLLLSILLMVLDHREHHLTEVRASLSLIVAPIQYAVSLPFTLIDWVSTTITTEHQLREENAHLRAEHLLLQAKLQRILALEKENENLRALLKSSPSTGERVEVASVLAIDSDAYSQQFTIAKGRKDGVFVGQPVLDATGVVGQVVEAGPVTSVVLLLTDIRSAIPVENSRNGVRAIANGTGAMTLSLADIPKTAGVKPGDVLLSSGLGARFPAGYPVGTVKSVSHRPGDHFATIDVEPSASFNRSALVLLVWPKNETAK